MTSIKAFTFNPFQENTYVVFDENKNAFIFDPGCYDLSEKLELDTFIDEEKLNIVKLINTHCHIDHVLGNAYIKSKYNVELYIHPIEEENYRAVSVYSSNYGFDDFEFIEPDQYLSENTTISLGDNDFEILFTPGHSPGHVVFVNHNEKYIIGGDVLFQMSIGRSDLPGGDHETLLRSIREKLYTLPDDYHVLPGHGPMTTIGFEKKNNPFCKA